MTPDGEPDDLDLKEVEAKLRADLTAISGEIEALTEPPETGASISFGKRIGEGTSEAISRFAAVGVANDLQSIRERTDRALAKLDEGTYGQCDSCGKPIPAGRLKAAPASPLCIECARASR